nr:efflux RND transporter permease subunit [Planctomycetota bacterium]
TPYIKHSISELRFEIVISILLTGVVAWIFLRSLSSTLNVLLAIPMSLFGALAIIHALGWTLNLFTLLALGLAVGIVVDDAILVLESIVRRREAGDDKATAASRGTKSIAFAALAASIAVVAIIVPVVFMRGVIGQFFLQFGVALSLAVMLSYIEAVTLAPARCAQFLTVGHRGGRFGGLVDGALNWIARVYDRCLNVTLRHPWLTTLAATLLFAASLYAVVLLPREQVPAQEQSRLRINFQTAVGSDIHETDALIRKAETLVDARPEVARMYSITGGFGGQGANGGLMFLTLVPPEQRDFSQQELIGELRRELNAIPGLRALPQDPSVEGFGGGGKPVEFSIGGADWDGVVAAAQAAMKALEASGTAVDVDSNWRVGSPELAVEPNRARADDLGVSVTDIAKTIQTVVGGLRVAKFTTQGRRIDLRVQVLESQRDQPEDIGRLHLRTRDGTLVPASMLITSTERPTLQQITRRARERAVTITANVAEGSSQGAALAVVDTLGAALPDGLRMKLAGASQAASETGWDMLIAFGLGVLVAYMVLAAQFNSFKHPITVLMILPLALSGGLLALLIAGKTLNLFSGIGLILLMGLAKKNSIVLVDVAARRRAEGADAIQAMRDAGAERLRPILMTSIAIIAAAMPIAIGLGPGGELRAPMAIAIVGGMIVATTLSLLVVPAIYVLFEKIGRQSE